MTDWTPGVKADATKVCDLLTDRYTNPTKNVIRRWVIAELKAAEPTLVLDLWGGGRSAAEMTAAGLNVLSVDDGRSFAEFGITKPRGKRAMTVKGELDGYRTGWGSVVKHLPECDAAWLDFMGHLAPETEGVLRACVNLRLLVVTLMAERMAGVERLSVETWAAMYTGAIEKLSGLDVQYRSIRRYRRPGGQWVLVILARQSSRTRQLSRWQARNHAVWADPERRERKLEGLRAYAAKNPGLGAAQRRAKNADPDRLAQRRETHREQMADPEYREKELGKQRERMHLARSRSRSRMVDPEVQAKQRASRAAHPRAYDPAAHREQCATYYAAHREQINERARASWARKKAERLNIGGDA